MTPFHYPPPCIAPLSSTDSSDARLLDDHDTQTRVSYGGRKRTPIAAIIPGFLIFIASAGLASSLLIWLQFRHVEFHIPQEDPYFLDAIVAIEAIEKKSTLHRLDDGSLESGTTVTQYRQYGLIMSLLGAQLVSLTVPILLGLLGYRLASMWILAQEKERTGSMPTAAQYGLLVKLCGSANLSSAYETVRYLKRGRERRPQAPSSLIFAFSILVLAIVLNYLLSAANVWLQNAASTFIHTSITEIAPESMPAMGTKINVTTCPGPTLLSSKGAIIKLSTQSYYSNCAHYAVQSASNPAINRWGDVGMITEGLAVVGNSSSTSRSLMVDDVAVLVPSTMPDNVDNLTFNSFGLVTHCQPVVDCSPIPGPGRLSCPSFNPPYNTSRIVEDSDTGRIDMLNLTNNASSSDPFGGYPLDSALNPYGARVVFYWLDDGTNNTAFPTHGTSGWYQELMGGSVSELSYWYISTCNMTAYNVSLSYSTLGGNNGYAFASPPVLSNFNTTSALFAALDPGYQKNLVDYLQTTLRTSFTLPSEVFSTVLSRNMSYATMGFASPLFERDNSTGGNSILPRSASRYPLAPLSAVLAILYTYALLALVITASSVMLSSREIVVTRSGGKEHRVTAIELIRLRLTNPLASIAEHFVDPARPELLLEPSAIDMFHEYPHADKLRIIMADDEGEDGEGIISKMRTLRVESIERRLTSPSGSTMNITETL